MNADQLADEILEMAGDAIPILFRPVLRLSVASLIAELGPERIIELKAQLEAGNRNGVLDLADERGYGDLTRQLLERTLGPDSSV